MTASKTIQTRVDELKTEYRGISFGYLGNCGVDSRGQFDDRTFFIFISGYIGTQFVAEDVRLGRLADLPAAVTNWPALVEELRRKYNRIHGRA